MAEKYNFKYMKHPKFKTKQTKVSHIYFLFSILLDC